MALKFTKKLLLATSSLTALISSEYGNSAESAQMRNLENRVAALEQRKNASGMINPPGRPQIRDGADLFIVGDLLCWNAHENGLQLAVENDGSNANLSNADVKSVHGKWNVGFRVGIGYNTPHDGWDLRLNWLRFTDNGRKNTSTDPGDFLFPTRVHPENLDEYSTTASKMKSRWHLNLNQLDLDLGRQFFVSKWLTLRPHFGLRTDWIRQKLNTDYINFNGVPTPNDINTKLKNRWWALGLEGGLDTQWGLGCGWSFFGNLTAAILYGFHHIGYDTEQSPAGIDFVSLTDRYRVSHPTLDLEMGVRWDNMFSSDRFHLGLQIGWEHHIYFSQNQFPVFVDDVALGALVSNQGDLTLQGWTFSARFDF